MSGSSHLPPRSPVWKKGLTVGFTSQTTKRNNRLQTEHHQFPFEGAYLEDETLWLDDLSINSKNASKGISLRRSTSDPVALLHGSSTSHNPIYIGCEGSPISTTEGEIDCDFEMACVYGPNSPRQKNEFSHSDSMIVSALLENASLNSCPLSREEYPASSRTSDSDDIHNSSDHHIPGKAPRRRSRQRSRVRKLQYIAELERTIDAYEVMRTELVGSVASMFQQQSIASAENKKLKQKISTLQQQKMIKEGQYQYLQNEVERLKVSYARLQLSKRASNFRQTSSSANSWQMLDLGKLGLSGTQ